MKQTTLFVSVGRADPRPLCSVVENSASYEAILTGAEHQERLSLLNGGTAADRIAFTREDTELPEAAPVHKSTRKGR